MYDKNNIFAKIVRGEVPAKKVVENEHALSFYDVNPVATTHVLVIPKGEYSNMLEFLRDAPAAVRDGFWDCVVRTADAVGADAGCNILANVGRGPILYQSVPHFHLHLMVGKKIKDFSDSTDEGND